MTMVRRALMVLCPQILRMMADDGFVDYDSDYEMKAETGKAPATSVDPYAGSYTVSPFAISCLILSFKASFFKRIVEKKSSK